MFKKLKALVSRGEHPQSAPNPTIKTVIAPEHRFIAIGDIHGCDKKLAEMIAQLESKTKGDTPWVFLGDAIDRGPNSALVLKQLFALNRRDPDLFVVLMGNHERMMIDFIDDPSGRGAKWLVNGGIETLGSFGIGAGSPRPDSEEALNLADQLEAALPAGMQDWLRDLPLSWQSGNMHCVHAGMNPEKPTHDQSERSLLWGHPEFLRQPRDDGNCVVHGHTIMDKPSICDGRISLDTGAYRGGNLTAALIDETGCQFLQA